MTAGAARPETHDVLIVGGGIGGLAAAVALRRRGLGAIVCERAPSLDPLGAGLLVPPNAMQVLARLGLGDAVAAAGEAIERAEIRDHRGRLLCAMDLAAAARRHGAPTVAIHRARLHAVLRHALPATAVHLAAECIDVSHRGDGVCGRVEARFHDGATREGALLVGADGVRSIVREQVAARARPRPAGQIAYRGIARLRLPPADHARAMEVWAPGWRLGYASIARDEVYWFATFDAAPNGLAGAGRRAPGDGAAVIDWLRAGADPFPRLADATDPAAVLRTELADLPPLPRWHVGRIVLLGDAAHASTPDLGQGGAQAIEDAWVLAERLARARLDVAADVERALDAYERQRRPRAALVVQRSRWMGRAAHLSNPIGRELRNVLMRMTPDTTVARQLDRFYASAV